MERVEMVGTKDDGLELRYIQYDDGSEELDEIVVYSNGNVLYHAEKMDDKCRAFQVYAGGSIVHGTSYAESGELISKIHEIMPNASQ